MSSYIRTLAAAAITSAASVISPSISSVTRQLDRTVDRLDGVILRNVNTAGRKSDRAAELRKEVEDHDIEIARAIRIRSRISNLVR